MALQGDFFLQGRLPTRCAPAAASNVAFFPTARSRLVAPLSLTLCLAGVGAAGWGAAGWGWAEAGEAGAGEAGEAWERAAAMLGGSVVEASEVGKKRRAAGGRPRRLQKVLCSLR